MILSFFRWVNWKELYFIGWGVGPKAEPRLSGTKESVSSDPTRWTENQLGSVAETTESFTDTCRPEDADHPPISDWLQNTCTENLLCYQRTTQQMWCLMVSLFNPSKLLSSRTQDTNKPLQLAEGAWRPAKCGKFNLDVLHRGCFQHTTFSEGES